MKRIRSILTHTPDALEIVGLAAIGFGISLVCLPAAICFGGAALVFLGEVFGGDAE